MKRFVGTFVNAGLRTGMLLIAVFWLAVGCEKESGDFFLTGIGSGDSTGLLKSSLDGVPLHPVIAATFSQKIDPATVTAENILLEQDYNHERFDVEVSVDGKTLYIRPLDTLCGGIRYHLFLNGGIRSEDGVGLVPCHSSFTTGGTFAPRGAVAFWGFNGSATDEYGRFSPTPDRVVDISYAPSRNPAAGHAASFNGTTSIIEIPHASGLMNSRNFTLCFWVKTASDNHPDAYGSPAGHFVMGLAAFFGFNFEISGDFSACNLTARYDIGGGRTLTDDLKYDGDGQCGTNGGWEGTEYCRSLKNSGGLPSVMKDKWVHVVYRFDSAERRASLFINGEVSKVENFNLWPSGYVQQMIIGLRYDGNLPGTADDLAFGFIQSRTGTFYANDPKYGYSSPSAYHFKGMLDDVRIYHKAITDQEIQMMYDSESKPF